MLVHIGMLVLKLDKSAIRILITLLIFIATILHLLPPFTSFVTKLTLFLLLLGRWCNVDFDGNILSMRILTLMLILLNLISYLRRDTLEISG